MPEFRNPANRAVYEKLKREAAEYRERAMQLSAKYAGPPLTEEEKAADRYRVLAEKA